MQEKLLLVAVFFFCISLTGCSFNPGENGKHIFGFVRKNVGKSVSLRCDYPDEEGKQETAFVKDDDIRMDGVETKTGFWNILVKEKKLWVWKTEEEKGIFFDIEKEIAFDAKSPINPKEIMEKIEFQKQNCSPAIVADEVFEIPKNIEFSEE